MTATTNARSSYPLLADQVKASAAEVTDRIAAMEHAAHLPARAVG